MSIHALIDKADQIDFFELHDEMFKLLNELNHPSHLRLRLEGGLFQRLLTLYHAKLELTESISIEMSEFIFEKMEILSRTGYIYQSSKGEYIYFKGCKQIAELAYRKSGILKPESEKPQPEEKQHIIQSL
ncbi:hypothetical protein ACMXYX_18160 (plasmid) [Neptuniibacter sp. QD72_48]|uniref:hypothetical protein n=1 Tax=Neptuniibacter sp. QD72_48 TaxID=3398214 RepID=UPI0039F47CC9